MVGGLLKLKKKLEERIVETRFFGDICPLVFAIHFRSVIFP